MLTRAAIRGVARLAAIAGALVGTAGVRAQMLPPPTPDLTGFCPTACSFPGLVPGISDAGLFSGQAYIHADSDGCFSAPDPTCSVELLGGSGWFHFDTSPLGLAVCLSDPESVDPADGVGLPQIGVTILGSNVVPPGCRVRVAGGAFTNVVCGTGSASGTSEVIGPDGDSNGQPFNISFYGTIGIMRGWVVSDPPNGVENIYGVVQIGPSGPGAPLPDAPKVGDVDCATGFTATGAVVAFENSPS
jgi:hypothetical protein